MEQTTEQASEEQAKAPQRPTEMTRPVSGRVIAGVAAGIAERFGLPVLLIRIGFVATAFAGGLGVALYLAGWALIRSADEADTPADRFFRGERTTSSWVGIALIIVAGLIILGNFTFFSGEVLLAIALLSVGVLLYTGHIPAPAGQEPDPTSPPADEPAEGGHEPKEGVQRMSSTQIIDDVSTTETLAGDSPAGGHTPPPSMPTPTPTPPELPPVRPREKSILGRLTIGVMLLGMGVLAILDNIDGIPIDADPRHYMALAVTILGLGLLVGSVVGRARWLIIVGAFLVPTLLFSPAFEYDWESDNFDVFVTPAEFDEIAPSYTVDAGNLVIDLTELDWDGELVELDASVDVGNLEVRVPEGVALDGAASVDVGRVGGPNGESWGFGEPSITFDEPGDLGMVVLDLEVNVGNINVFTR